MFNGRVNHSHDSPTVLLSNASWDVPIGDSPGFVGD